MDGINIDWEDIVALEQGTGEAWLDTCTREIRKIIPRPYIVSHSPMAPFF